MTMMRPPEAGNPRLSNLSIAPGELTGEKRNRLSIVVDVDDVLFPWYDRAHLACVEAGLADPNGPVPVTWHPWEEYGVPPEAWWEALRVATHNGTLYAGIPFEGAVVALWRLEVAGHFIHLVTARGTHPEIPPVTRESIRAQTQAWVHHHHLPFETLTFSHDKTVVPADFSIDDNLANYDALEAAGHGPYLVNRPWNGPRDDGRRRVDSLAAFAALLLGDPA